MPARVPNSNPKTALSNVAAKTTLLATPASRPITARRKYLFTASQPPGDVNVSSQCDSETLRRTYRCLQYPYGLPSLSSFPISFFLFLSFVFCPRVWNRTIDHDDEDEGENDCRSYPPDQDQQGYYFCWQFNLLLCAL